jgi:hypothetical protein
VIRSTPKTSLATDNQQFRPELECYPVGWGCAVESRWWSRFKNRQGRVFGGIAQNGLAPSSAHVELATWIHQLVQQRPLHVVSLVSVRFPTASISPHLCCHLRDDGHAASVPGVRPEQQGHSCAWTDHLREQVHRPGRAISIPRLAGHVSRATHLTLNPRWIRPCLPRTDTAASLWHNTPRSQANCRCQ